MLQVSQLMIDLVLQVLGRSNLSSTPFRFVLVLAKQQRMGDLLLRVPVSACKTLRSIR